MDAKIILNVRIAPAIAEDSWLREKRFKDFVEAYDRCRNQTQMIGPLSRLTPEQAWWVWYGLQEEQERIRGRRDEAAD